MSKISNTSPGLNILLVSRDRFLVGVYRNLFTKYGHAVHTEEKPLAAIHWMAEEALFRKIQVAFVDFPGLGCAPDWFIKQLRKLDPQIIVEELPHSLRSNIQHVLNRIRG